MKLRSALGLVTMISTSIGLSIGCAANTQPSADEPVGTTEGALTGTATVKNCTSAVTAFTKKAINVGKFIAQTDEFKSCVSANYKSCDDDNDKITSHLVSVTSSVNPLEVSCGDLGWDAQNGGTYGLTSWDQQHDYGYDGTEAFQIDSDYAVAQMNKWNAGNFYGAFALAGDIWHEAMHTHGYHHGNSGASTSAQQAIENADSCGRKDDPAWFWRANAAPYDVNFCMIGAWTQGGAIGRSGPNLSKDDKGGSAGDRSSIIDVYYKQAHKLLTDTRRDDTFTRIGAGTLVTPAALKLEAAGNSLPAQASPITFNGASTQDTLFDAQDQEYWVFTVASDDRVHANVSFSAGSPAPTLEFLGWSPGGGLSGVYTSQIKSSASGVVKLDQDLKAGTYVLRVRATAGTKLVPVTISVSSAPPPSAPTSCSGFVNCLGHVHASCSGVSDHDTLILQRMGTYFWSTVHTDYAHTRGGEVNLEDDGPFGRLAVGTYRVCAKTYGETTCGATFTVGLSHQACWDQFSCDSAAYFACFDVQGDEHFCCHDKPVIDTTIPTVQIPGPIVGTTPVATGGF